MSPIPTLVLLASLHMGTAPEPAPPGPGSAQEGRSLAGDARRQAKLAWRRKHGRGMFIAGAILTGVGWGLQFGGLTQAAVEVLRTNGYSDPECQDGCGPEGFWVFVLSPILTVPASVLGYAGAAYAGESRGSGFAAQGTGPGAHRMIRAGAVVTGLGVALVGVGAGLWIGMACYEIEGDDARRRDCLRVQEGLGGAAISIGTLAILAGGMTWAHGAGLRRGMGRRSERGPSAHWGLAPWIGATPGMAVHGRF